VGVPNREIKHWRWRYPAFADAWRRAEIQGLYEKLKIVLRDYYNMEITLTRLPADGPADRTKQVQQPIPPSLYVGRRPAWAEGAIPEKSLSNP
jgi:hypothetical protein